MTDAIPMPLFRRLRFTPLRDLSRGRLTGRLDYKSRIAAADLPADVKDAILLVVRRTRLWRLEKAAVAEELLAHFLDALAAGRAGADLLPAFGDPAVAAKLIRRAKRRGRSVFAKGIFWAGYGVAGIVGLYGLALARFELGRPVIAVDYIARSADRVRAVPPSDRAWPVYRDVLLQAGQGTGPRPADLDTKDLIDGKSGARRAFVKAHPELIDAIRRAAAMPELGFVPGPHGSVDDPALYTPRAPADLLGLRSVERPYLNQMRILEGFLDEDTKLAVAAKDGLRFAADMEALLGMARQFRSADGCRVTQWFGSMFRAQATEHVARVLAADPAFLDDATLIRLAHALAGPRVVADLIDVQSDQADGEDLLQRLFTDDGHGDGRITPAGLDLMRTCIRYDRVDEAFQRFSAAATVPGATASRAELSSVLGQLLRIEQDNFARPIGQADWSAFDAIEQRLQPTNGDRTRYYLLPWLVAPTPALTQGSVEAGLGARDGVEVAIALELYRRHHGNYPATLAELVPQWIPEVPADRISGGPVKYRIVDGKPLIYSVGADKTDDGGRRPAPDRSHPNQEPPVWDPASKITGDWVLFPPDDRDE